MTDKKQSENSISVIEMDKKKYKELIKNTILLKRENENLKIENDEIQKIALDKYNEIKTSVSKSAMSDIFNNIKNKNNDNDNDNDNDNVITTSSIFKKKSGCTNSENKKNKTISLINTTDVMCNDKKTESSSTTKESEESEESEKSTEYSNSESTDLSSESDIYRTASTDDGINKTYRKLNEEMERLNIANSNMNNKEVAKRIDFLLNGLRILDGLKNKKK